jgi:hypothetical protein
MNTDNNHGFTRSEVIAYRDNSFVRCPFCHTVASLRIKCTEVFCGEAFADILCEECNATFTERYIFADIFVAPRHDGD